MRTLILLLLFPVFPLAAQQVLLIPLPDAYISANRLVHGDGDTYGLGDWTAAFSVSLDGAQILLTGTISFTEKANDYTTIVGTFTQRIESAELEGCSHCDVRLETSSGTVSGPNIGARGYRWFDGQGIIKRAWVQTDTFGDDTGKIGGNVQFMPLRLRVHCSIAMVP